MTEERKKDWKNVRESMMDEDFQDEAKPSEPEVAREGLAHPSYADLELQLTLAEQKAHENWDKSVRALAEVDNIKRRTEREVTNAHRYALEKFVTSLLPVVDSLEQAFMLANQQGDAAMCEGLELTMKLFIDVLTKHGVTQVNPLGEIFDPQWHEAMSMQPTDTAVPNTVLAVVQKGYVLNERMVRPARVVVAKA